MEFTTELLPHQNKAVQKLKKLKVGALFMEMGTGKTRTALELISLKLKNSKINHILWLCPYTIKNEIKKEIKNHLKHYPEDLIDICGIETLSSSIKETLRLLELVKTKNVYLIVDESSKTKNINAIRTKRVIEISRLCKYKLILNGTPITKTQIDLFSQMYILDWRILGYSHFRAFERNHIEYDEYIPNKIKRIKYIDYIAKKIAPYSYEIKKSDLNIFLPDKVYIKEYFNLSEEQRIHYDIIAYELLKKLDELVPTTLFNLFYSLHSIVSGFKIEIHSTINKDKLIRSRFYENPKEDPRIKKLIQIIKNNSVNEKYIICCTYLDEIEDIIYILNLEFGENSALAYTGQLKTAQRDENKTAFQNFDNIKFLVAIKQTISYGLNLQFAKNIIYFSNDWNFGTRIQSEDRIHRIGQSSDVKIFDIICDYSIDLRIQKSLNKKEDMLQLFLEQIKQKQDKKYLKNWIDGLNLMNEKEVIKIEDMKG